jgi:hypothetical protein
VLRKKLTWRSLSAEIIRDCHNRAPRRTPAERTRKLKEKPVSWRLAT